MFNCFRCPLQSFPFSFFSLQERCPGFLIVTPGVRPEFATNDDQKRVTTPAAATSNGADYLVIGRPILRAVDRAEVIVKICGEIEAALP